MKYYQTYDIFPEDESWTNSSFKMLRSGHIEIFIQKLNKNNSIKYPEITISRFDLNVSKKKNSGVN